MKPQSHWTLEEALELIRKVEPAVKEKAHCFLALCGGVLRRGYSDKDLDVLVVPLNGDTLPSPPQALDVIAEVMDPGSRYPVTSATYNGQTHIPLEFTYQGKRIEFVVQVL